MVGRFSFPFGAKGPFAGANYVTSGSVYFNITTLGIVMKRHPLECSPPRTHSWYSWRCFRFPSDPPETWSPRSTFKIYTCWYTLPETNSSPVKIDLLPHLRKFHLLAIDFQGQTGCYFQVGYLLDV